jgi:hypothetical protein
MKNGRGVFDVKSRACFARNFTMVYSAKIARDEMSFCAKMCTNRREFHCFSFALMNNKLRGFSVVQALKCLNFCSNI